jgi:biotin carboxylase/GNAT superfamily N-acetyltransferase
MDGQVLVVLGPLACASEDLLSAVRRTGARVTVLGPRRMPECGPMAELVDRVETVRLSDWEQVLAAGHRLNADEPVVAVLGYEDDTAPVAARLAAELGLPGHPADAALAAMDKPTMKLRLAAAGVPIAEHLLAVDEDDAVRWALSNGYPVVVKPVRGAASQGVIRADDEDELRRAYRRLRRIVRDYGLDTGGRPEATQLVERYLDGAEIAVELIVRDGEPGVIAVFEKPQPLTGPFFEETIYLTPPAGLDPLVQRQAEEVAIRAARGLGLRHGPAHCELRLTEDGPVVLEIAARLIGGACARVFRDRLGQDLQETLVRVAMGEPVDLPEAAPDAPVVAAVMLPVPGEGRVLAVHGADRAARVPGIRTVSVLAEPGDVIVPFPEPSCYEVGFLSAAGRTHQEVEDALVWASASITLDLAPVSCERWSRPLTAADAGLGGTVRTGASREEVERLLAEIVLAELPRPQALREAAEWVRHEGQDIEGQGGEPSWVVLDDTGVVLSFVRGETGYVCCVGVRFEERRGGLGRELLDAQLAEFARRGCTRAVVDVDPRHPVSAALFRGAGFTPQPREAQRGAVHSCALNLARAAVDDTGVSSDGCCSC